jgi:DNA-binding SARP family transcriptional activator
LTLEPVRFAVLGPVRVWRAGEELEPGRPQERALLALLLARAGGTVTVSEMVDALWGQRPPKSAVNVIRRHVGALRRLLEPGLPARAAGRWLVRGGGGYRLVTDAASLDLLRFRALRDEARGAAGDGRGESAVELLTEALALWQGPAAAGIAAETRAHPAFGALERERLGAVKEAADAALRAGLAEAVVTELRKAAADSPLDEPLLARLVLALAATGHRAEALSSYRAACSRLAEELGIDPGPELRDAHLTVLREAPPPVAGSVPAPAQPPPAQLPHDLSTFTGRRAELEEALALLSGDGHDGPDGPPAGAAMPITAISGMAGIGKTTLAVHWAHRIADRFPDGQLYVNLRGFDPSGALVSPGEALRGFLDTLGVAPERVPYGVEAQAALYRSLLAGRRVLVLLDNARDTEQVEPLLPGTPGCLVIVTSRDRLSGLVTAHGAHTLALRPLDGRQARAFLARRLGDGRIAAEPRAVEEIVALCAGLPLALACVAGRAAAHPRFPLSAIADELREAHGSLDAFARTGNGDGAASAGLSGVFSWSSRAVSPGAARLFRLLALHPGPDFPVPATAALAGVPVREARLLLAELSRVHLLNEHAPGRYAIHDLLRAHAAGLARVHHSPAESREAVHRLLEHLLHTAQAAGLLLAPYADPMPLEPPGPGTVPEPLPDDRPALAWFTAEYAGLLASIDAAVSHGFDSHAARLAWSMEPYFDRRGHWHDGAAAQRTALEAAQRLADPAMTARAHRGVGRAAGRLGRHHEARDHLDRALELFTGLGDDTGRADTHRSLGWESEQRGDLAGALQHNRLALNLFRATGRQAALASVLNSVGWYHALLGEHRQALDHCFEALTMLQDLGDRYGQAATWDSIAYAYHHLGRHPQAVVGYHNALALYRDLEVPYCEADTLTRLGDTHRATGDRDAARDTWLRALAILTRLGHPDAAQVRGRLHDREDHRDLA